MFSGPFEYDDEHRLALRTVGLILQSRLLDSIRQELGGTYSITATPGAQRVPRPEYSIRIEWTSDPARTEMLVRRVFQEIEFVRDNELSTEQVTRIRDVLRRELDENSQDNGYLLDRIARRYEEGAGVASATAEADQIAALSAAALHRAAAAYLNTERYVKVTLMPAGKK